MRLHTAVRPFVLTFFEGSEPSLYNMEHCVVKSVLHNSIESTPQPYKNALFFAACGAKILYYTLLHCTIVYHTILDCTLHYTYSSFLDKLHYTTLY